MSRHIWTSGIAVLLVGALSLVSCTSQPLMHTSHDKLMKYTYPSLDTKVETDVSQDFLRGDSRGASVARTAPGIDFGVLTIDPKRYGSEYGAWGNVVLGPDQRYYFGLGNHPSSMGGGDGSLLVSYDSRDRTPRILLFSKDVFGPQGEGKWHGRPDINPGTGEMYLIGFYRGHIVSYNIYTQQAQDLGIPVPGSGWPEHVWDWQRQRLYGVGDGKGSVLVYDTGRKIVLHQGKPIDARSGHPFYWDDRARLLDRKTGCLYGTDAATHRLAKYDPKTNTFALLNARLPGELRAWTNQKDGDGAFWIMDDKGDIYKFYANQDRLEYKGKNWANGNWYTTFLERSADGRYLYYSLSSQPSSHADTQGEPVVQYDTRMNKRKVIAFLSNYYVRVHHYQVTKIYGGALSTDGSTLFLVSNGNVVNGPRLPAIFAVHIPSVERE